MKTLAPFLTLTLLLTGCAELTQLRERTEMQDREIQRLRSQLSEWQSSYQDLLAQREEDLAERNDRIESLQTEVTRLTTRQSVRERELETRLEDLNEQIRLAETELATTSAEADTLRAQTQNLTNMLGATETERAALMGQINEIEALLGQTEEQAAAAAGSEQALRSTLEQTRDTLQRALSERDQMITDLRNRLLDLQQAAESQALFTDAELSRISDYLTQTLETASGPDATIVSDPRLGVIVTFQGGDLFESGSTVVRDEARTAIVALGYALAQLPETSVQVIGHTDNEPVSNMPFRDNWQVSASRAENVMRVLTEETGLSSSRCLFTGAGEHHPIQSNSTLEGRRANRRVEIIVAPDQEG